MNDNKNTHGVYSRGILNAIDSAIYDSADITQIDASALDYIEHRIYIDRKIQSLRQYKE